MQGLAFLLIGYKRFELVKAAKRRDTDSRSEGHERDIHDAASNKRSRI